MWNVLLVFTRRDGGRVWLTLDLLPDRRRRGSKTAEVETILIFFSGRIILIKIVKN